MWLSALTYHNIKKKNKTIKKRTSFVDTVTDKKYLEKS